MEEFLNKINERKDRQKRLFVKLIRIFCDECGSVVNWGDDDCFYMWVRYEWIEDFILELKSIFGCSIFSNDGQEVYFNNDDMCINLTAFLVNHFQFEEVMDILPSIK